LSNIFNCHIDLPRLFSDRQVQITIVHFLSRRNLQSLDLQLNEYFYKTLEQNYTPQTLFNIEA